MALNKGALAVDKSPSVRGVCAVRAAVHGGELIELLHARHILSSLSAALACAGREPRADASDSEVDGREPLELSTSMRSAAAAAPPPPVNPGTREGARRAGRCLRSARHGASHGRCGGARHGARPAVIPPAAPRQPVTAGVKAGGARHGARRKFFFFMRLRPSENAPLPLMAKRRAVELKDR